MRFATVSVRRTTGRRRPPRALAGQPVRVPARHRAETGTEAGSPGADALNAGELRRLGVGA